jgi:hypothetical protein
VKFMYQNISFDSRLKIMMRSIFGFQCIELYSLDICS